MNISNQTRRIMTVPLTAAWLAGAIIFSASVENGRCQGDAAKSPTAESAESAEKTSAESLDWQNDFYKALEQAKVDKKFVLVDVYTDWCVYCKKLDKEVYPVPSISKYLSEHFILVKANAEDSAQGQAFADKFDAHAFPTILVFNSADKKEKPTARISGYLAPAEFDAAMHSIVESKKYKPKRHR